MAEQTQQPIAIARTNGAHVAGVSVVPTDYVPSQQEGLKLDKETGLMVAEGGLQFLGPTGLAASGAVSFLTADEHNRKEVNRLTRQYSAQIAQVVGKNPQDVTPNDMIVAAHHNKSLARELEAMQTDRESRPIAGIAAIPGFLVGGALGTVMLPFLPFVGTMIGGFIGGMAASKMVDSAKSNNPENTVDAKLEEVRAKFEAGEQVQAVDVFKVRLQQDVRMGELIHNKYGKPFEKLDIHEQIAVMQDKDFRHAAVQAMADAQAINAGDANPNDLINGVIAPTEQPQQASGWAARVGAQASADLSHVEQLAQQRTDSPVVEFNR